MQKKVQRLRTLSVRETNYCRVSRRVKYLDNLTDFLKDIDSKGPIRTASKPRSALDEEVGHCDRDLFYLTNYQVLCLDPRTVFPEIPVELCTTDDLRVFWPERIMGLECETALWTFRVLYRKSQSCESQHLILSTPLKQLKSSNELTIEQSNHLRCHRGLHLTSTGIRRLCRQRRSQDSHRRAGQTCLTTRQTSTMGLHLSTLASEMVTTKTQSTCLETLRLLLDWLTRPTHLTIEQRRPVTKHWRNIWNGATTRERNHAIYPQTRRCERGSRCQRQKSGTDAEAQKLLELQQCTTLRKTCPLVPDNNQDPSKASLRQGPTLELDLERL